MSIEGQHQRRAFLHDPHAGMAVSVDPTLVPLRLSKPSLQVQIVAGQVWIVPAHEQSRIEAGHRLGHVLGDGAGVTCQGLL